LEGGSGCVKGPRLKVADCEGVLLKNPDIARLMPPSFDDEPGLLGVGVFGDFVSETGVGVEASCLPAEGGGVADVKIVKGG